MLKRKFQSKLPFFFVNLFNIYDMKNYKMFVESNSGIKVYRGI